MSYMIFFVVTIFNILYTISFNCWYVKNAQQASMTAQLLASGGLFCITDLIPYISNTFKL